MTDDDFRSVAEASILAYNAAATSEEAVKVVCPTPQVCRSIEYMALCAYPSNSWHIMY